MELQVSLKDLQQTKDNIFFIVGTSRSGSTLLQSMLSSHSQVVVPPETHYFYSRKEVDDAFKKSGDKEQFCRKLLDFWYAHKTRIQDLGIVKEEVLHHAEMLGVWTPLDLYVLHLTIYRKQRNKDIIGEKTPLHVLHIEEILEAFPKAKIISLFRDPRAASYSEIKAYFGSPSVLITTKRWRTYVNIHFDKVKELPSGSYMMMRYCELIAATEKELKKISKLIEVAYESQMLEYYNRDETGFAKGESEWKKGTLKPLKSNKNREWRRGLREWQVALIEEHADCLLMDMGYKPSVHPLPFLKKWFYVGIDLTRSVWATITNARDEGYTEAHEFARSYQS